MMMFGSRTASARGISVPSSTPPTTPAQIAQRKVQEIFQASPENQCCADCTARLTDSVWASTTVGAFLCIHCAGAHRTLGVQVSRVKSLHLDAWTDDDVPAMKGGNKRVHEVYAKHADKWCAVDATYMLKANADTTTRERTIRAKYEDMKFTKLPTPQQIANANANVNGGVGVGVGPTSEEKGQDSPEHPEDASAPTNDGTRAARTASSSSTASGTARTTTTQDHENQQRSPVSKSTKDSLNRNQDATKARNVVEVSKRFLNYFVVLGRGSLVPNQNLEKTKGPTDLQFFPNVIDQYPDQFDDSPLSSHLAQFAFPEGYALSQTYAAPTFFSFVLTNVSGVKIYACALRFHEELHPLEVLSLLAPYYNQFYKAATPTRRRGAHRPSASTPAPPASAIEPANSDNNQAATELPKWIQDLSGNTGSSPGPVFCPKCVVVMSHYPYFSASRQFLQQIYRITLSEAPMPIERYITNFVSEVPLPPHGRIQVQLTLPDRNLIISRPPRNELPLIDFSFRPLFQALDINNVLQLFTCAVLEFKIVLCSKHIALLTPAAESILALLLPFAWQGAYIPVLPSSLLDIIDAPVPFLVGVHSDCMSEASSRASGVVFVDLDHNRVIPAIDECGKTISIPKLPEREGAKLRVKLFEHANIFDPFAPGLNKIDLAFPNDEHLTPIGDFASERGHTVPLNKTVSESTIAETNTTTSSYSMGKMMRGRKPSGAQAQSSSQSNSASASPVARNSTASPTTPSRLSSSGSYFGSTPQPIVATMDGIGGLTDSIFNDCEKFSTQGTRKAFLRFFVTLLRKYATYLNLSAAGSNKATDSLFDAEAFLRDNVDAPSRSFVAQLIGTQMFDRFVEDRVFSPMLPEVLFFDQSINQKLNRSITIGKKKYDCSFLDDRSDEIRETFIAPPPSNIGLPDDGTVYRYKSFPKLKKSLFGTVRKPRELFSSREQQRNVSQVDFHQRLFTLSRCMKGSTATWEGTRRLIICLQTQYRVYSARKQYQSMRKSTILIQRWARAHMKGHAERVTFLRLRNATIKIQTTYRTYTARNKYLAQRHALHKLQFFARGYVAYARFQRAKRGVRRLQAQWRSSFHKRSYKNLKHQIIRMQSRVRGLLSRKRTMKWKSEMFEGFRRKIFDLWEQCDVPLLHRSKFWLTFNRPDFFNLGIYLEEERRLQAYFRDPRVAAHDAYEYSTQTNIIPEKPKKGNGIKSTFRALVSTRQHDEHHQKGIHSVASARIAEERHQLYDSLKRQTSVSVRTSFYQQFGIPVDSKKKKRRLANLVWTSYSEAGSSAEVFITVSCFSDRYHPLPAQIDRHKQLRIRDDLAFTVNAALKSIRYASPQPESSSLQPTERELIELQHQVRMLASQNHRLTGELQQSQREMSRLQMELQLHQSPQLRKRSSIVTPPPGRSPRLPSSQ